MGISLKIEIFRGDQAGGKLKPYVVNAKNGHTVLDSLFQIYENIDPTLAFRCGCRYRKCGLCAVMADGKARLACLTPLAGGMTIEPLKGLPLVRDLVVDRRPFFESIGQLALYLPSREIGEDFQKVIDRDERKRLMACTECLACLATCLKFNFQAASEGIARHGKRAIERGYCAGPYFFVKLAQLFFDPRDKADRAVQAKLIGIDECRDCGLCYCPIGIPLYTGAILPLLGG